MAERSTLVKPKPIDPSKAPIENVLELTELSAIGPDMFTNTRPLWHPPGARGIYGGAVIAQCLSAAQLTVPANFTVHSMHCYFVLAGDSEIPVMYYVEHIRSGKSFATRTVQAKQRGKAIFTTTMSFVRENSGGTETVKHAVPLPKDLQQPKDIDIPGEASWADGSTAESPLLSQQIKILNGDSEHPHEKRTRQWVRARGRISNAGGHQAHLSALAYMSDSYFIGTVTRIHELWRFGSPTNLPLSSKDDEKEDLESDMKLRDTYFKRVKEKQLLEGLEPDVTNEKGRPEVGMMVSLDHSIYFHEPRRFRADEWMLTEMSSPWSGDGRGVVTQHMFAADGTLIATCFQEGVVRLKEDLKSKI